MKSNDDWHLSGGYFETCNCLSACPCIWFNDASEGECKLLVAWHIEEGHFNDVSLNDLNVALACHAPGNMKDGAWQAALYLDARSSAPQQEALTRVFSGNAGGHLALLMGFVGEVLGVRITPIQYYAAANHRRVIIPGVAQAEIEGIAGIGGGAALIENPPLCVVPSHPAAVAKSVRFSYRDYGKVWSFSDRNGFYSAFDYAP